MTNFEEFALGGNPKARDAQARKPLVMRNGSNFDFRFPRSERSVTYIVQRSSDLLNWSDYRTVTDSHGEVGTEATVEVPDSQMESGKLFLRLRVQN